MNQNPSSSPHRIIKPIAALALVGTLLLGACEKQSASETKSDLESPEVKRQIAEAVATATVEATQRVERELMAARKKEQSVQLQVAKDAISAVSLALKQISERLPLTESTDLTTRKKYLRERYSATVAIPIFRAPEDFRNSYGKYLAESEKLVNFVESIPANLGEESIRILLNPEKADLDGSIRKQTRNALERSFQEAWQELLASAAKYNVAF